MSINWLPLSDRKGLDQVKIVFEEPCGQFYGGYYEYDTKKIVVVHNTDIRYEASTIAHEYRHHIQAQLNTVKRVILVPKSTGDHQQMIRWYFRSSPSEYDALLYQNKVAKSELSQEWLNWTVK